MDKGCPTTKTSLARSGSFQYDPFMHATFLVKPETPFDFLSKIPKVFKEGLPDQQIQSINVQTPLGNTAIPIQGTGKEMSQNASFKGALQNFKERTYLDSNQMVVSTQNGWELRYHQPDDHSGTTLRLSIPDHLREHADAFADAVSKHFTIVPKSYVAGLTISDTQMAGFRFAEKVVASLATETAKISQATVQGFEGFVDGVKQRTLELEENFQKKTNELETRLQTKTEELQNQHNGKLLDLETREKAHAEAVKQFELRNNTAVRRDLLKEIRTKIEEQKTIQISDSTTDKRRIVHWVCGATLLLAAGLMALFAYKLFKTEAADWKLLIPLSTSTAVFVMTGIFYIRWNDQWFRDHARVEFENRKFSADILRASWIAELFFEWAEKKGINMPAELVESFTKNLFDNSSSNGRLHPADQLQDMIKEFSTLELGKGGFKVTRKNEKNGSP